MLYREKENSSFFPFFHLQENARTHAHVHRARDVVYTFHSKISKIYCEQQRIRVSAICIACGTELVGYRLPLQLANGKWHAMKRNSSIWFVDKAQCVYVCMSGKEITIKFCDIFSWKFWASFSSSTDVRCSYFGFALSRTNAEWEIETAARAWEQQRMNIESNRRKHITCTRVQVHCVSMHTLSISL